MEKTFIEMVLYRYQQNSTKPSFHKLPSLIMLAISILQNFETFLSQIASLNVNMS